MKPIGDYENVCRLQERIFLRIEEGTILKSDLIDGLRYLENLSIEYPNTLKNYSETDEIEKLIDIFNFNCINMLNNIFLILKGKI